MSCSAINGGAPTDRAANPRAYADGGRRARSFFSIAGLGFAEAGGGSTHGTRSAHFIAAVTSAPVVLPPTRAAASTTARPKTR